ncbi:MAG TPA: hypothetical protein VFC78_01760 [Tepidisphaeraceae bacterium]|nr:hypothetical protein [Tepidisphaeraceae bacterium]
MDRDDLLTLGQVAGECGDVPLHRLRYAIEAYRIEPRQRAGILRLWHRDQLPELRSALARIGSRREVAHA